MGSALIEPALGYLKNRGATLRFGHQLHAMRYSGTKAQALDFGSGTILLASDDAVILAIPPTAAASIMPGLETPTEFRAIVNAHFRIEAPQGQGPILGVLNATTEWIFAFPRAGETERLRPGADPLRSHPRSFPEWPERNPSNL